MKKLNQVIKILIIMCSLFFVVFANNCFASQLEPSSAKNQIENNGKLTNEPVAVVSATSMSDIFNAARNFIQIGKEAEKDNPDVSVDHFASEFAAIGQILVAVGVATLLIVTGIMAIKWITATPDKQAKLKQQLIGLVIAAVVIFGAIGIWNFVRGLGESVEEKIEGGNSNQVVIAESNRIV